jgi:uncharacterized membrane protein YraQ (UPF0718 family)
MIDVRFVVFLRALGDQAVRMGGFFLLAVLVAALIKTFKLDKKIRHLIGRAGSWDIPLATAVGLVSPLCSCGIMPVVASLMAAGVPTPPLMALLISSPIMSPDAFVLTAGVLGPTFAWWKLVGAACFGLSAGYLSRWAIAAGWLPENPWKGGKVDVDHHCVDQSRPDDPRRGLTVAMPRWRYFLLMVGDMLWIIGRFLVVAYVIEAAMRAFVPANTLKVLIGDSALRSILLGLVIGIPWPLHQVAAVPILRGLLDLGLHPAGAMTLLMAGPATSIPAMMMLGGLANRRLLWLYLAIGIGGSLVIGLLFAL